MSEDQIRAAVASHNSTAANHGNWTLVTIKNGKPELVGTGNGVSSLSDALSENTVGLALLTLRLELEAIPDQPRNIYLQWVGPKVSRIQAAKSSEAFNHVVNNLLIPNHGQIFVKGKNDFNEQVLATRWHPSAGSHEIH
eukprot:TRINITY_DN10016_c0_g1_i1.p1 TRINITY_DN10016_c0_g1~~TRINITY_DN10016_c0_g1_i1.p1  ORF type:complete len:150 (+),score=31.10 TRINITY_DN10016_c0_g1_i1:34-450(+)